MAVIRTLKWDPWNVYHIARHRVTPDEVEAVCRGLHIRRAAYAGRMMLIGSTEAGRMLAVVLEPLAEDVYRPITARDASRKEKRLYAVEIGGVAE